MKLNLKDFITLPVVNKAVTDKEMSEEEAVIYVTDVTAGEYFKRRYDKTVVYIDDQPTVLYSGQTFKEQGYNIVYSSQTYNPFNEEDLNTYNVSNDCPVSDNYYWSKCEIYVYPAPNNNEIWYISNSGETVTPYVVDDFYDVNNNKLSFTNTYENGKGVMKFSGDISKLGNGVFYNCKDLAVIAFPESTVSFGNSAFESCTNLKSVNILSRELVDIKSSFANSGIESLTLYNCTVGNSAFYGCKEMKDVTIYNGTIKSQAFSHAQSITVHNGTIEGGAFAYGSGIKSVTLKSGVASIGAGAFERCTGLMSITLSEGLTTIGNGAFAFCSGLSSVVIPSSVTSIGGDTFYKCDNLTTVTLNSNTIVSKTYAGNSNLKNIFGDQVTKYIIGDSVESIGTYAFAGLENLTDVEFGKNVTTIGQHSFAGCTNLTSIVLPDSVTNIVQYAFNSCSKLKSVTFGKNKITIGYGCFGGTLIESIVLQDCIIESRAFQQHSELKNVTIYNGTIGTSAFAGCYKLETIVLGDGVTSVDYGAFSECPNLLTATLPSTLSNMGNATFAGSTNMTSVTCYAITPPTIGSYVFEDTNNCPIYVPAESVDVYKAASGWSTYADRIQAIP